MDKQRILVETRNDLVKIVSRITFENLDEFKGRISDYLEFIGSLAKLEAIEEEINQEIDQESVVHERPTDQESEVREDEVDALNNDVELQIYKFERKLRGGVLPELNNGYFIPEWMVRDLEIEHSDELRIIDTYTENGVTRHRFNVHSKGSEVNTDRIQLNRCVVEEENGKKVVGRIAGMGDIEFDGNLIILNLREDDISNFSIKEGDIVDIAFYRYNPNGVTVMWKHFIQNLPSMHELKERKVPRTKEQVENRTEADKQLSPEIFKGKQVLVIGGKSKEPIYRDLLRKYNAECETMSGWEEKSRVRAAIKNADIVVINTADAGHPATKPAVEMCKQFKKVFDYIDTMGNQTFLKKVQELLEQKEGILIGV